MLDGLLTQPLYGTHMYVTVREQVRFREPTVLADVEGSAGVCFCTNLLNRETAYKCVTKY